MAEDGIKPAPGVDPAGRVGPDLSALPQAYPNPPREGDSPLAGLPRYGGIAKVEHLYQCGDCEQFLRTTRSYSLPTLVFLGPVFFFRDDEVMKCPRCMRRHILARLPLTIALANLLSPLLVIWWLAIYVRTFFSHPG